MARGGPDVDGPTRRKGTRPACRRGLRHAARPADVAADRAGLPGHDRRPGAGAGGLADADPRRAEPHGGRRPRRPGAPCRLPDPPQITRSRFEDMLEVRLLLEPQRRADPPSAPPSEQVAGLRRMLEEMAELVEGDGPSAYGAFGLRDAAFHDLVAHERGEPGRPRSARLACTRTCTCSGCSTTPRSLTWRWPSTKRSWRRSPRATPTPPPTRCVGISCCRRDRFRRLFDEAEGADGLPVGLDGRARSQEC